MRELIFGIAVALVALFAAMGASRADAIDVPDGIHVKGCADYELIDNRVRQSCSPGSIPQRDVLTVTEFFRAFRGAGGSSEGGSESGDSGCSQ